MSILLPDNPEKAITYASSTPTYRPENGKVHRLGPLEIGLIVGTIGLFVLTIAVVFFFRQVDHRRKKAQIAATLRRVEEGQDGYQRTPDQGNTGKKACPWWKFGARKTDANTSAHGGTPLEMNVAQK